MSTPQGSKPGNNGDKEQGEGMDHEMTTPGVDIMESPPGMGLRSGLKKRRRSRETTGLTPPDEVETKRRMRGYKTPDAKRQRVIEGDSEEKEEEETEDTPMEDAHTNGGNGALQPPQVETPQANLPPAPMAAPPGIPVQEGTPTQETTTSVVAGSTPESSQQTVDNGVAHESKTVAPIQKLRMPSKYTPGKVPVETARIRTPYTDNKYDGPNRLHFGDKQKKRADEDKEDKEEGDKDENSGVVTTEKVVQQPEQSTILPAASVSTEPESEEPPSSLSQRLSMTMDAVREAALGSMVSQADVLEVGAQGDDTRPKTLVNGYVWFGLLLLLQLVFWPLWINPILTSIMEVSDSTILLYKGIVGAPPKVVPNVTVVEKIIVTVKNDTAEVQVEADGQFGDDVTIMDDSLGELDDSVAVLEEKMADVQNVIKELEKSLNEKGKFLDGWEAVLTKAETNLKAIVAASKTESTRAHIPVMLEAFTSDVDELELLSGLEFSPSMVDPSALELWELSSGECLKPTDDVAKANPLLTIYDLDDHRDDMIELAESSLATVFSDAGLKSAVQSWLRTTFNEYSQEYMPEESSELAIGLTEAGVRETLGERLEVEIADGTGLVDWATIQSGATVIRTGTRATSPSLAESLPILNRVAAQTKFRFYGHGPEVALTPTQPRGALGQCWAVESIAKSKISRWRNAHAEDPSNGEFATLTIRLAEPIHVGSVMIEHAPKESTRQASSAILEFRVIGYVDADASSQPYPLGVFRYDIGKLMNP